MKIFRSKKGVAWEDIKNAVLTLAAIAVLIFIIVFGILMYTRGIGCEGVFTSLMSSDDFKCSTSAQCTGQGGQDASEISFWSIFSGGCSEDRICCKGKGIKKTVTSAGLVTYYGDEKLNDKNELPPGAYVFAVQGGNDVVKCSMTIGDKVLVDKKDCKDKVNADSFEIKEGIAYIIKSLGYNAQDKEIIAKPYTITVKKDAEAGGDIGGDGGTATDEIFLQISTNLMQPITQKGDPGPYNLYVYTKGDDYAEEEKNMITYDLLCPENSNCILTVDNDVLFTQPDEKEVSWLDFYELAEDKIYTFTLRGGNKIVSYKIYYSLDDLNIEPEMSGVLAGDNI